ncbi:anthranilate synthase component I family protein [Roseimaritima ulvae]|uniref:Anthranilate synthase component 1 n=1 Tax=Roseimaritima ulvae TaxID=980254 RepID=A0A5B9QWM6_9BACT|nr:anthranilate synthase component I family protein [Roseimaritima ulvae]QEG42392.1 Anthranilate synthase component 1 [Roseimaritima ulvae]
MNLPVDTQLNFSWLKRKPTEFEVGVDIDFYKLFYALKKQSRSCYFFESLELPRHQDRYFTIGFDPLVEFLARGNQLTIQGDAQIIQQMTGHANDGSVTLTVDNPYQFLQQQLPMERLGRTHQGGLVGYFCYESVNYFEPAISLEEHPDYPNFHLGLYADGLILDNETGICHYYTYHDDRSHVVRPLLPQLDTLTIPTRLDSVEFLGNSETREAHTQAIENTLEEVRAGNTFQAEVGFKSRYHIRGDKIAVYDKLRQINPSPYMFYVVFEDVELMGASPEVLIANTDKAVLTTPTAGTTGRSSDPQEDRRLARALLTDPKEIAEHNMLVDLHRNDLSRVCRIGTVRIASLMYLIRFSHVQHIVSDVVGELADGQTAYDLLAAILPGGVVSGAPKIETMKIIDRNENTPRGPYGGAVGRFSFNGDSAFCLPIRSLFCKGDECFSQTCSGVVLDSSAENEYNELKRKLAAMQQTLQELSK